MVFEHAGYRSFLKNTLAERVSKNPAYSLRALAKQLDLSATFLSKVTRGQKNLSVQSAQKICHKLHMGERESEYFCSLVQYETTRSPEMKAKLLEKLNVLNRKHPMSNLDLDAFQVISDWYHMPILEMTRLANFKMSPLTIAQRLGITTIEAEVAIDRLLRLGLLKIGKDKKYRKSSERNLANSNKSNQALRHYHKQTIAKALQSVEVQDPKERFLGADFFSVDPRQIPEAKLMIEEFIDKLLEFFRRGERQTEIYQFSAQLLRVTKKKDSR
jgi:uncharacterized protein (TIGR02147 family)